MDITCQLHIDLMEGIPIKISQNYGHFPSGGGGGSILFDSFWGCSLKASFPKKIGYYLGIFPKWLAIKGQFKND